MENVEESLKNKYEILNCFGKCWKKKQKKKMEHFGKRWIFLYLF